MTKLRNPGTTEAAIQRVLGILLDEGVETATGKRAGLVRAWADPDDDTHHIQLRQAIALDAAMVREGHSPAILDAYTATLGKRVEEMGGVRHQAANPLERLTEIMAEVGDVAGEVRACHLPTSDGGDKLTAGERVRIAAQAQEAIEALQHLLRDIEA